MFRAVRSSDLIDYSWGGVGWNEPPKMILKKDVVKKYKKDTVIMVLAPGNYAKEIEEVIKPYIIFKSKKAVNYVPGHGRHPRNTVYVLEFSNDGKA